MANKRCFWLNIVKFIYLKYYSLNFKNGKNLKRLTEERNAAMEEYSLVMRERDSVHKEIEKLQEDLLQSNKKVKTTESKINEINDEKKMLLYQVESLRREIISALDDRDTALKVCLLDDLVFL